MTDCIHALERIEHPSYRYRCAKCHTQFKIATGVIMTDLNKQELDRHITGNYGEDQFIDEREQREQSAGFEVEKLLQMIVDLPVYGPGDARNQGNVERAKAIARQVLKELLS